MPPFILAFTDRRLLIDADEIQSIEICRTFLVCTFKVVIVMKGHGCLFRRTFTGYYYDYEVAHDEATRIQQTIESIQRSRAQPA